jgi:cardiolipin synthase A/B
MNIGREYEGLDPALGHWRDVQVEADGPVVRELQDVFADDWFFATGEKISGREGLLPRADRGARHLVHVVLGGPDRRGTSPSASRSSAS